jgi:hypothetical protein
MDERIRVPNEFYKDIDPEYVFKVQDCTPTKEIEVKSNSFRIAFFDGKNSYRNIEEYYIKVPESIFVRLTSPQDGRYLITKKRSEKLYIAGHLFRKSHHTGHRVQKYLTLFRAYECMTKAGERNIYYSSIRHSLSHSITSLTKPNVINALNELFGGLDISLDKFRHKKVFFKIYSDMLIDVDNLLFQEIEGMLPEAKELILGLKIIDTL